MIARERTSCPFLTCILLAAFAIFGPPSTAFVSKHFRGQRIQRQHHTSEFILQATGTQSSEREECIANFAYHIQDAIVEDTFVSLTLSGASKKKKKNDQRLRGSIREVQGRLIQIKKNPDPLLQLTIKFHEATDICKNLELVGLAKNLQDFIVAPPASEWGPETVQPFQRAELVTLENVFIVTSLHQTRPKEHSKPLEYISKKEETVEPRSHDRTKQVPLAQTKDKSFLQALGLTKPDGSPKIGMSSKIRQCNKFVEIVNGLVGNKATDGQSIRVVDMGCGRGYLTFALHSYLAQQYGKVESMGIDVRPKLVAEIAGIAKSLGGAFDSLSFQTGTIEAIVAGEASIFASTKADAPSCDILIALHACDTATDDAIWSAISQQANIIVVAPCCHKQIRPQLNANVAITKSSHPMYDVLKHGVYRERISETITDSLRALLLEIAGYQVQVFEFIGGEHTSKNVMITAVKSEKVPPNDTLARIQSLAEYYGISQHKLASWMEVKLSNIEDAGHETQFTTSKPSRTLTQMPPKHI